MEIYNDYAEKVLNFLNNYDIRAVLDDRNEKIGKKIRDNELKRIPFLLIVGEKEAENDTVAVRKQGKGDMGAMTFEEFINFVNSEVKLSLAE